MIRLVLAIMTFRDVEDKMLLFAVISLFMTVASIIAATSVTISANIDVNEF